MGKDGPGLLVCCLLPVAIIVGLYIHVSEKLEKERESYCARTFPICQRAMRHHDTDKNGALSSQEGVRMARAVGIHNTFPSENLSYELIPGSPDRKTAFLKVYSPNSAFSKSYEIPLSRLENLNEPGKGR